MSPANKLTLYAVWQEFAAAGCVLLESEYIGNKQKLRFRCGCGGEGVKTLIHFRRGRFCTACGYKNTGTNNGRLSLDDARAAFSSLGCTLLATEYLANDVKMPYLCKCGSLHEMSLANMKKGKQCPTCIGKTAWTLETVQAVYRSHGCELLEDSYQSSNATMKYRCACGSESATTLGNFLKGVRCKACGIKKLSGPNSYLYDPNLSAQHRAEKRLYPEYRDWRKTVLRRDDYTCHICGIRGSRMHAHHLDSYARNPELRTDPNNGVTLCKACHDQFHLAHGVCRPTTRSQFEAYMEAANG